MYIYGVIHYFVEDGQNVNFHLIFGVMGGKNDFRKMAMLFLHEIDMSISKTCWLQQSFQVFFSKVCMPVT